MIDDGSTYNIGKSNKLHQQSRQQHTNYCDNSSTEQHMAVLFTGVTSIDISICERGSGAVSGALWQVTPDVLLRNCVHVCGSHVNSTAVCSTATGQVTFT